MGALGRSRPVKVLVVDDEPDIRLMLRLSFRRYPEIEVTGEAGDGAQAVRLISEGCPDLVVLDIMMPLMNGFQAAPLIKTACPETKILMFSAVASLSSKEAIARGADGFVEKGTPLKRLADEVLRLCAA